jgi:hypothetical protein
MDEEAEYFDYKPMNNNFIKHFVRGNGFQDNLENEKMNAQVPPDARASMRAAAEEEPTKNRMFDITYCLNN